MNLVEILKNAPEGTKLYSTIFGYVELLCVTNDLNYPIKVKTCSNDTLEIFTKEGKYSINFDGECVLFPAKENRDWNTFKIEKSYEFKPFDKVLVRAYEANNWSCNYFSHMSKGCYVCLGGIVWNYCIPYNDETKHLIGTTTSPNSIYPA